MNHKLEPDHLNKLTDPQERQSLYDKLAATKSELIGKVVGIEGLILRLKVLQFSGDRLECRPVDPTVKIPPSGELVIQILVATDMFMTSAHFTSRADIMNLDVTGDVYKIQRRENFRLRIPISSTIQFKTDFSPVLYTVVDLSAGGCQIHGPHIATLKNDTQFKGVLKLPGRFDMIVNARVAHIRNDHKNDFIGIEFMGLAEKEVNRLAALVMDLYRELYLRKS